MTAATRPISLQSAVRTMTVALGISAGLWWLGNGALSTPPVDSWSGFRQWLAVRSTAEAALASLRSTAAAVALHIALATALTMVAQLTSVSFLERVARSIVPRSMRPLIGVALGAGMATAAASMAVPKTSAPTYLETLTLDPPTDATATMYAIAEPSPTIVAAPIPAATAPSYPPPDLLPEPTVPAPASAATPLLAATIATPGTWTIARGDHLWAVAHETLADSWQRPPTDAEVVPYWLELIERNRNRLVDPSNPDYVLAGQVFELPEVPARQ
jgi:hypothetical protein